MHTEPETELRIKAVEISPRQNNASNDIQACRFSSP
jgi:hypothetical protein